MVALLCAASVCAATDVIGAVIRSETSPGGPRSTKTSEKLTFRFPTPVKGRFWWDYDCSGTDRYSDARVVVPDDRVPANTEFALAFIQAAKQLSLTATTNHDGEADSRSRGGYFPPHVTHRVTYWPSSERIPVGKDLPLFSIELKSTRPPYSTHHFRVFAHFTSQ